jgi:hypothetical protein
MKTKTYFYLFILFLFTEFSTFAQLPGEEDGGGDPQPAPINGKLILLAITAILYVIFKLKKNKSHLNSIK